MKLGVGQVNESKALLDVARVIDLVLCEDAHCKDNREG